MEAVRDERKRWHMLTGQILALSTKDAKIAAMQSMYEMTGELEKNND